MIVNEPRVMKSKSSCVFKIAEHGKRKFSQSHDTVSVGSGNVNHDNRVHSLVAPHEVDANQTHGVTSAHNLDGSHYSSGGQVIFNKYLIVQDQNRDMLYDVGLALKIKLDGRLNALGCKIPVKTNWNLQLLWSLCGSTSDREVALFMTYVSWYVPEFPPPRLTLMHSALVTGSGRTW